MTKPRDLANSVNSASIPGARIHNVAGRAGLAYGTGAAGACNNESQGQRNGAAGANGIVVVEEFF